MKTKYFISGCIIIILYYVYIIHNEDQSIGIIPVAIENQVRDSVERFPKHTFDSIRIRFTEFNAKNMTWATRPSITSLFRTSSKRTYLIQQSAHPNMKWLFDELPYDGQIGILVHELCHIQVYENMTKSEIIEFGYRYQFDSIFRRKEERRVDSMARAIAPKYWYAWKNAACTTKSFDTSAIAQKYWKKQKNYYLTSELCNKKLLP